MRILVLDGNQNQAVACVRSLARQGHRVFVGEAAPWSKAGWSRYCSGNFTYTSPQDASQFFLTDILNEAAKEKGTLVLPMTEATTLPVSANRVDFIAAGARFVLPEHSDLLRAVDKNCATALAKSLGIAVPKTYSIDDVSPLNDIVRQVHFPVVLKPRSSQEQSAEGKLHATGRPAYASNEAELATAFNKMQPRCSSILIQEFVEGTGTGYFALMNHGELRAEFAHRRIRDVHPTGSGSALRESIVPSLQIRESSLAMLRSLNWHGVAMVEFRVAADGTPVFLEINGRFWHSLALACAAGVDFPSLLARMAEDGDVDSPPPYKTGVRSRWLVGDFRHLIEVWKGCPPGYPGKFPGRWSTLKAELTPTPGTFHDNFDWNDPLPELGDWIHLLQQVVRNSR
ncbi:MAG TPA: ATP-grasp domain-containing protein [Candidatus Solibacter sp.]|nr:ATP-grasp domain-containing protein [Candidatus Solibacter sp.]